MDGERFRVLLYPRGRIRGEGDGGPASAYLRYAPRRYGDEVDVSWKLRLRRRSSRSGAAADNGVNGGVGGDDDGNGDDENDGDDDVLPVSTSGGLPRSSTTWSAAMTLCADGEGVESAGRASDWGSSAWSSRDVLDALGRAGGVAAEGEITVFAKRGGERSLAWPPGGALGAVCRAARGAAAAASDPSGAVRRDYRAGEVIVPRNVPGLEAEVESLRERFVYPGIDYRIMTMSDGDGNENFSTKGLRDDADVLGARVALRPCGWKLQRQLWERHGMRGDDWPVEVDVGALSRVTTTRFNPESAAPRVISAFQRDWVAHGLALAVALAPVPLTLLARSYVSLYDIPSASMEPTLLRGDVLLVEKFPGAYGRSARGDVVLFEPPPALRDVVSRGRGAPLPSTSLFVKRLVGMPGDRGVRLVDHNDVSINGAAAVGPDRNLCADEPLRLIDGLLEDGKGTDIPMLGDDDVYVLGDCKAVSVDSRVFGVLPKENIVGRPVARIWPLSRIKLSGHF